MNPLLKVSSKRISIIQKETNIASFDWEFVYSEIDRYVDWCQKDISSVGTPKKHHRIPEFLLKDFEGNVAGYSNRIQALRYKVDEDSNVSIDSLADKTTNDFSRIEDFYTIQDFYNRSENNPSLVINGQYRIEKLLAVIESNASPLLKYRQKKKSYRATTFANPYLYPEDAGKEIQRHSSSGMLETTTGRRIVLSVFFAAQYLRSTLMSKHFAHSKKEIQAEEGSSSLETFPEWIERMLPMTAKLFYGRTWRWLFSAHDGFMPGGTPMLPLLPLNPQAYSPATEHSLVMPLGRNATIYFRELGTFWKGHDGVFTSVYIGTSNWTIQKLIDSLAYDLIVSPDGDGKARETIICMHPETTLAHLFKTEQKVDDKLKKEIDWLSRENIARFPEMNFLGDIYRKN